MRSTHHTHSITTMGTVALPAPRHTAATQWAKDKKQKNSPSMRICITPMAITSGSLLNRAMAWGASTNSRMPMTSAMATQATMPNRAACLALS